MPEMKVGAIFEQVHELLELERVPGTKGLDRVVEGSDISSPGLALSGYVKRFVARRMQVFGETEVTYLFSLDEETRRKHIAQFFSFPVPCVFVTKGLALPADVVEEAVRADVAILRSALKTHEFYNRIKPWLDDAFAPQTSKASRGIFSEVWHAALSTSAC